MKDYTIVIEVPYELAESLESDEATVTIYVAHVQAEDWPGARDAARKQAAEGWTEDARRFGFTRRALSPFEDWRQYTMLCGFEGKHDPQFGFQWED
jgi:hypothetical protein